MTTPTYSEIFCCGNCHDSVAIEETQGGDLVYQCSNSACQKAVSVDCPEALAIIEDVVLKLPVRKVAAAFCITCGNDSDCPDCELPAVDPFAPMGACAICGGDAWCTTKIGLLCPIHELVIDAVYALDAIWDRLEVAA